MSNINEKNKQNIIKCPLFTNIPESDITTLLDSINANHKKYDKNEYIFISGSSVEYIGIVLSGRINVLQEDYWGNRKILASIGPQGIFAEAFSCAEAEFLPVSVIATTKTEVLLIRYNQIITARETNSNHHAVLIKNMLKILAEKNIMLTQKMNVLTRPTTRERLLTYLSSQAIIKGSNKFTIPFDRQELADYLSVNRSAMSRELSQMIREGLIKTNRSEFELLAE